MSTNKIHKVLSLNELKQKLFSTDKSLLFNKQNDSKSTIDFEDIDYLILQSEKCLFETNFQLAPKYIIRINDHLNSFKNEQTDFYYQLKKNTINSVYSVHSMNTEKNTEKSLGVIGATTALIDFLANTNFGLQVSKIILSETNITKLTETTPSGVLEKYSIKNYSDFLNFNTIDEIKKRIFKTIFSLNKVYKINKLLIILGRIRNHVFKLQN